jgi:hypothetical protein
MKTVFAFVLACGLSGCAAATPQPASLAFAPAVTPPWRPASPVPLYPQPNRDSSRLPLPGDTGFAWDKLNHRGNARWECRALPSGQFVRQSFCKDLPQVDQPRPAAFSDIGGWDGMVHAD